MSSNINRILNFLQKKATLNSLDKFSHVELGSQFKLGQYAHFQIDHDLLECVIGNSVEIRNFFSCVVGKGASLSIADQVFMNNSCSINCLEKITIGENTLFGENVRLYDHNHKIEQGNSLQVKRREFETAPIHIGKNCWLASNVVVLKGVTIGDNSIIGTGVIVHKDVAPNSKIINYQNTVNINP